MATNINIAQNTVREEKRKKSSMIISVILHVVLLAVFYFFGLTHEVPIPVYGMEVNFGQTDMGSGTVESTNVGNPAQDVVTDNPNPVQASTPVPTPTPQNNTPTQSESPIAVSNDDQSTKETKPVEEVKQEPVEKPVEEQKVSDRLASALGALNSTPQSSGSKGQGESDQQGNAGSPDGDINSRAKYGDGGNGNYLLGNRKPLNQPKYSPKCQEQGTVVIDVVVNRKGETVKATVSMKGSTNTAKCLTDKAIASALETKWQAQPDAPYEQRGQIKYKFVLN